LARCHAQNEGNIEPLAGFEERLLARLAAAPLERKSPWARWPWFALAAAAALVIVLGLWTLRPVPQQHSIEAKKPSVPALQAPAQHQMPPVFKATRNLAPRPAPWARRLVKVSRPPSQPAVPKLASFPAPSPLTAEEAQIIRMARLRDEVALAYMRLRPTRSSTPKKS